MRAVDLWIAVAGGGLAVYQWAVARPLWLDEQMIAINIRERGFGELAGKLSFEQSAPYGWLVLERIALLAGGSGERTLRVVPLLFGLATIATAVWIGRRWLTPIAAAALVLLASVGQWISYSFVELKHYSADTCFALLLPALAAWSISTPDDAARAPATSGGSDRVLMWWVAAAVAQLFANGALFVTPLCAVAIVAIVLQERGFGAACRAAAPALVWAAIFAANYAFVLRPAQTSEFLQSYWQADFPPAAGFWEMLRWIGARLGPFALKPGGTRLGLGLWAAAVAGFASARGRARPPALMFATVPLSVFLLATLHFVPFFERLVLWVVPSLYVGVALLADAATVQTAPRVGRVVVLLLVATIAADVTYMGLNDLKARPAGTNHLLDDRGAVRWLAAREQPGDVWVTTHLALPAIWWYAPPADASGRPIVEVGYADPGPDCRPDALAGALAHAARILVFTGFHFDDVPKNFDAVLLDRLTALGQMTAFRGFEDVSRAAIFDRRLVSRRDLGEQVPGCLTARPARRW